MSHISRIELEVKKLEAMKQACADCGFEFMENQKTYRWYGRFVGDSPMPEGLTVEDLGKCDHAIRVPGASYEIGLKRIGDRYEMLYDYWSAGGLKGKPEKLFQPYAIAATKRLIKKNRYRMIGEKKLDGGAVQLRVRM